MIKAYVVVMPCGCWRGLDAARDPSPHTPECINFVHWAPSIYVIRCELQITCNI